MRNRCIGKITKVFFHKIVIEVPSPSNIQHNFMGDIYTCNGLNDFITIYQDSSRKYIYQITGLYDQEKPFTEQEESKFQEKAFFEAIPVGEVSEDRFEYGLSNFPMINEEVFLTHIKDIQNILMPGKETLSISFGSLTTHQYVPKIAVDKLFTNHMSILGNTGSGKSTTVRKMLNELLLLENQGVEINKINFIVFDVHNEYENFDDQFATYISVEDVSISADTLTTEDWINLVQPAAAVQLPVLLKGLRMASLIREEGHHYDWIRVFCALELYNNQQTDAVTKRAKIIGLLDKIENSHLKETTREYNAQYGNFTPAHEIKFKSALGDYIKQISTFDYESCHNELDNLLEKSSSKVKYLADLKIGVDLVLLLEESKGNAQVRSYSTTLMTRIDNLLLAYSSTFFDVDSNKIERFNEIKRYSKALTIFDCSTLTDEDLLFFSSYIIREIFDGQRLDRQQNQNVSKSYNIVLDEAHRYLKETNLEDNLRSIKTFERIAKEGRKFGVFLILASQRPGELSKTVISQCNNFLLHRIRNNLDLDQIRKSIPYINDSQLFRLSYLRTGVLLAVGEAFEVPMEVIVDGEKYSNDSQSLKPSHMWLVGNNEEMFMERILETTRS